MLPFMCSCTYMYSESFVSIVQTCLRAVKNYYTKHPMSLHLPVTLYCSMHFRRHGGGSRSGSGLWLSDGWYVGLSCVCLRACADGLWTVCMCAFCAGGSIKLYILHILHNIILHLLRLFYLSLLL